ncbi:MAG: hypothetical protein AAFQ63_06220 [Cyanobacteria bacterium J06621_11]
MIRQFLVVVVIAVVALGSLLSSPLSAIAGEYQSVEYSQSHSASQQKNQTYPGQSDYEKSQDASDYSYTDKQKDQAKPQNSQQSKQSSQMSADEKQYSQKEQSYQNKQ